MYYWSAGTEIGEVVCTGGVMFLMAATRMGGR
jgi:hypothetical protein